MMTAQSIDPIYIASRIFWNTCFHEKDAIAKERFVNELAEYFSAIPGFDKEMFKIACYQQEANGRKYVDSRNRPELIQPGTIAY